MTDATDHALEQAERIVQYAKYSDRFMVVEGDSTAERRAFVKLIGQKLPRQVRPVLLRADAGNGSSAMIEQLSTLLQLSAGIETIEQLITAATAALEGQDRLLIVVENADHWLDSDGANALFELINQAHDLARERMLFLLVGATGLCERVETAQPLADLVADLHCAQLLGAAQQSRAATTAAGAAPQAGQGGPTAPPPEAPAAAPHAATPPARRSALATPTLLIAAVVSVAVVSVGAFALLDRSEPRTTESAQTGMDATDPEASAEKTSEPAAAETAKSSDKSTETAMAEPAAEKAQAEPANGTPDLSEVDHGQPPHVPFPVADAPQAPGDEPATEAEAQDKSTPVDSTPAKPTETAGTEAEPVTEEARGAVAATPPAEVDNDWYREQPRARAAVQMAAFGKLDDATKMIERFAGEGQPRDEWRIYTQRIDGKVLYTVTLGNYASAERARHAIDELPANLKNLKPYPRSVGAIQDRLADATP